MSSGKHLSEQRCSHEYLGIKHNVSTSINDDSARRAYPRRLFQWVL